MAIYTLAQNGTENSLIKPAVSINGQGSPLGNDAVLKGRAKRKFVSQVMSLTLVDITNKKEQPEKLQPFWNTYHCQNRLYSVDGRYYGKYCKNRFCTLCCSIRKAVLINKYMPVIRNWDDPYFVTLTVSACKAGDLKVMLPAMIRAFKLINEKYRKRNQRGDQNKLIGVKSLECNFNSIKKTYNPHFHLIVPGKKMANTIMREWLMKWTPKFASGSGQHKKPITNMEKCLIEIIKYGTKIFTEPDVYKKSKNNNGHIYGAALHNILDAMKGLRLFERFGFDLPKIETERQAAKDCCDYYEWEYVPQFHDWLNTENELVLTGYEPSRELKNLLDYKVDKETE